jgi:hypothetical protein
MWLPVLLAVLAIAGAQNRALKSELAIRDIPAPSDATDLDRAVTSYGVLDDEQGFVIAYYTVDADGLLHDLQIRAFDKRRRRWTYARHAAIGSVLRIARGGGFIYISGHSSPSAAPTLALDRALQLRGELDGWIELVLPDGRLIFQRSMTHFQETHAGVLAIYNPRTGTERTFYPAPGPPNERGFERVGPDTALDRSFSEVERVPPRDVRFTVSSRRKGLTVNRAQGIEPQRRTLVICNVALEIPSCVEQGAAAERGR